MIAAAIAVCPFLALFRLMSSHSAMQSSFEVKEAELEQSANSHSSSHSFTASSSSSSSHVFSFRAAAPSSHLALSSTSAGTTVPSSPGTPSSPAGLTHLRKLPFPNRLLHALPEYLNIPTSSHAYTPSDSSRPTSSSSSQPTQPSHPPVHRWLRLPLAVLTHMTPASAFTDPLADVVGDADKASTVDDQTLVEKIQQEKMKQEAQAALDASEDLAQGQSTLLGNASGGGDSSTPAGAMSAKSSRRLSTPMLASSVRSQRAMSLPHALPPLTLSHAALTTVLAAAQPSSKRKVTFSSLLHKLPHPSLKKLHYRRRTASFSHSSSEPDAAAKARDATAHTPSASSHFGKTPAASSRSLLSRVVHAPSHFVRSVLRRIGHMFREALFMLHLAAILLSQLGLFGRWAYMAFRLMLFAAVLCTAWAKIGLRGAAGRPHCQGAAVRPFQPQLPRHLPAHQSQRQYPHTAHSDTVGGRPSIQSEAPGLHIRDRWSVDHWVRRAHIHARRSSVVSGLSLPLSALLQHARLTRYLLCVLVSGIKRGVRCWVC